MAETGTANPLRRVLALDTSTDRLSVALGAGGQYDTPWRYEGEGGAKASSTLIPVIQGLLDQAGWRLQELDAIAFGNGPGAFTGLRTACAVVQGLAVAARPDGIPVLPVNTLLAVAWEACHGWLAQQPGATCPKRIVVLQDARMDEVYAAEVEVNQHPDGSLHLWLAGSPWVCPPEALVLSGDAADQLEGSMPLLAGNAMAVYGERLPHAWRAWPSRAAWPTASAMLGLAPDLWLQGRAVVAADAQPVYVRDKVAQTTEERERARALQAGSAGA